MLTKKIKKNMKIIHEIFFFFTNIKIRNNFSVTKNNLFYEKKAEHDM